MSDLRLEGAALGYPGALVLEDVDAHLRGGRRIGVVGPNGAGKTTLLRTLLGVLPPLSGSLTRDPGLRMGFVPQRERFDPIWPLAVLEVVFQGLLPERGPFARPGAEDRSRVVAALEKVGLPERLDTPFRALSGGQQQKVMLARALVREPDWLVLDEPTAGLDVPAQEATLRLVGELQAAHPGMGVLLVSHQLADVLNHMEEILLVGGDRVELYPVTQAFDPEVLSRFYGHRVRCLEHEGYRMVLPGESPKAPAPPSGEGP